MTELRGVHDGERARDSPEMSSVPRVCRKCRAEIFADAPEGLCTACLFETGLGLFADASVAPQKRDDPGREDCVVAPDRKRSARRAKIFADFGDYELLEVIGRGGQGVVYRALQKSLNRTVALKVIGLGHWASDAHLKRFRREAEAAASLDHSGIVPIYEVGERDGSCYFSMKLVEGGQLDAVLYQLLTGQPPFAGGTTYETIKLLLDTEPRQPRLLNPKIDHDLSTICLKCIEKDPKRRYSSALALAEDLERWLKHEPILARHTGVFARGRKWVRRNPTSALLAASLVSLAAAAGWMIWKSDELFRASQFNPPEKSIAILPFLDLSQAKDQEYFCEGISEEILHTLAKVEGLRVVGRTSSFSFEGTGIAASEVGKKLNVANVLGGSLRREGNRVRITAEF